jgi:hypothetical protein
MIARMSGPLPAAVERRCSKENTRDLCSVDEFAVAGSESRIWVRVARHRTLVSKVGDETATMA